MQSEHKITAHAFKRHFKMDAIVRSLDASRSQIEPNVAVARVDEQKGFFAFNFGAVAVWNYSESERVDLLNAVSKVGDGNEIAVHTGDEFHVVVCKDSKPRVEFNRIVLDEIPTHRMELIALTLAQSAAMEVYERELERISALVNDLVLTLKTKGKVPTRARKLNRFIGEAVMLKNDVIGVLHLLDRPDLIWEDRVMDGLYGDLRAVFDLDERFRALEYKLQAIQDSLTVILDTVKDRSLFLVEVAILALIAIEIAIYVVELST